MRNFECYFDPEMDMTFKDAKNLSSIVWQGEEVIYNKRRWLMGLPSSSTAEDVHKKPKRPKFLTNKFLPESFIRSDEVSFETIKTKIEKSFGSFNQGRHHVVQDYLVHFHMHKMQIYAENPLQFLKTFYSIMDDLNNTALLLIANTVTLGKVSFERTRQQMKNIIKEYLAVVLTESNYEDRLVLLNQLSQIFRNPNNFREKQLTLFTPVRALLLASIDKLLGRLHEMSVHTLLVMNRKLKGVRSIPQFPPVISISCKKEVFKERVGKKCHQMVLKLKEGMDLPKPLAKALSVMLLFLKQETGRMDITISEFFPFSSKTMDLQDDILRALWSLRKVKYTELKAFQSLIDPAAKIPWKTFRTTLNKYLMECLFECDEIGVSEEALRILTAINRRPRRQVCLISKEAKEEEIESVLNVSSQLKQFFSGILPESAVNEEESQELESGDAIENNDFVMFEIGCHSYMDVLQHQPMSNNELKTTEDSLPSHSSFMDQEAVTDKNPKQTSLAQDMDTNVLHASSKPVELRPTTSQVIQDICDETSLLSHKIIGHWLDKVMQLEGIQTDAVTRSYLRGESSQPVDLRGSDTEELLGAPVGDKGPLILLQVVEELLPNFPMRNNQWRICLLCSNRGKNKL